VRGEAIVTQAGLEGGAVYALSRDIRKALARGDATLVLSLRPGATVAELQAKLERPRGKQSMSTFLRKSLSLAPVAIALLHEAAMNQKLRVAELPSESLAGLINTLPIPVSGLSPLASAISTAGGIEFAALDGNYMMRARPGVFAAGEMLDWEAPTGGYLLQACFATGAAAGRGAAEWVNAGTRR
jgi:predicted flavoprotein YhiN